MKPLIIPLVIVLIILASLWIDCIERQRNRKHYEEQRKVIEDLLRELTPPPPIKTKPSAYKYGKYAEEIKQHRR